ncbi:MAG TPA: alpha/beta hydrolase [Terriglobia bacterium]|nr:alpha/beta hydrolase [Terriglobia bacterium]
MPSFKIWPRSLIHCLAILLICGTVAQCELQKDIEYGRAGDVILKLDASVPEGAGPFPAVIIVHGGGFTGGNKQMYVTHMFDPLTQAQFVWFSIDYRLAPQYKFPAAVEDVDRAIEFVKSHAAQFKVDPRRIALLGESAGGYMVSYVGTQNEEKWHVAAVVSFYGPHNLTGEYEMRTHAGVKPSALTAFLGITTFDGNAFALLKKNSPINLVRKGMPPYLLVHGSKDTVVDYQQSVDMCARLKEAGNACELYTVEGGKHGMDNWEDTPAYKQKVVEWLQETLH